MKKISSINKSQIKFAIAALFICFAAVPVCVHAADSGSTADSESDTDTAGFTITAPSPAAIDQAAQDVTVITADQIAALHTISTSDVLRKLGNLDVREYGASGAASSVSIRGFSGSAVAVLIDGVHANSVQTGEFDVNRIAPENIEKIEIVRGASDSKYAVSGAVGGIINIITKKASDKRVTFDVSNKGYFYSRADDAQKISMGVQSPLGENAGINVSGSFLKAANDFYYETFDKT